jgi:hypothetical protein
LSENNVIQKIIVFLQFIIQDLTPFVYRLFTDPVCLRAGHLQIHGPAALAAEKFSLFASFRQ